NIGYFKNVNVYAIKSTSEGRAENFRDVYIEVEENPTTAHFRASLSYSIPERLVFGVGLNENNFNIKGFTTLFTKGPQGLRGAGEYIGLNANFGKKVLNYTFNWSKPYFLDTPWIVGIDLGDSRNKYASRDYIMRTYSAVLYGRYTLNAFWKFGLQYRLSHSFIHLRGIKKKPRNRQLIRESENGGLISAVGAQLFYDTTNHPMLPTQGFKSTLSTECAGAGGDHHFARLDYLNSAFFQPYDG